MGLWDWLRGREFDPPRALAPPPEQRMRYIEDYTAVLHSGMLVHGPGTTDLTRLAHGDDGNSAVFACLLALATAYVEPPLRVYQHRGPDEVVTLPTSPLQRLLDRPNPYMAPDELWAWVQWAKHLDGNAYLQKVRSGDSQRGNVTELWPISPTRMELHSEGRDYITAYRYHYAPGHYTDLPPANVVHFRLGLDDRDLRQGLSPLRRLVRAITTDERAAQWTDTLLANHALPGLVVKVKGSLTPVQAQQLKAQVRGLYGGAHLGDVGVIDNDADMTTLGFNPEQMRLEALHRVPEERISAVLRVPAIVAGLGAGLDRSTYSNVREARELFTEGTLVPLWAADAAKLQHQLVPDFTSDAAVYVAHDLRPVRALQEDENAKSARIDRYLRGGLLTVNEARTEAGKAPLPDGDVLYVPIQVAVTPVTDLAAPPAPPPNVSALPRTASRPLPSRKAVEDIVPALVRQRDRQVPACTTALQGYLAAQRGRVLDRLLAGRAAPGWEARARIEDLIPDSDTALLRALLEGYYDSLLGGAHATVQAGLGVAFGLPDALTTAYLERAGANISGITDVTRAAVQDALAAGQANGEGIAQLAGRIRDLPEFGRARATTIARTELAQSSNLAALTTYEASTVVVGIRILDSDADDICAALNGRTFSLDEARSVPLLGHPNCVRAMSPLTSAAQLTGAA